MVEECPKIPNTNQLRVKNAAFDQKMAILTFFVQILGLEPILRRYLEIFRKIQPFIKSSFTEWAQYIEF